MNDYWSERNTVVAALLVAAAGIAMLWAGGVEFPVAVPPGLVMLLVIAPVVALVKTTWSAWLGCLFGVFLLVGFVVAGLNGDGFDYIRGEEGGFVVLGQLVELLGALVAAVSGFLVARSPAAAQGR